MTKVMQKIMDETPEGAAPETQAPEIVGPAPESGVDSAVAAALAEGLPEVSAADAPPPDDPAPGGPLDAANHATLSDPDFNARPGGEQPALDEQTVLDDSAAADAAAVVASVPAPADAGTPAVEAFDAAPVLAHETPGPEAGAENPADAPVAGANAFAPEPQAPHLHAAPTQPAAEALNVAPVDVAGVDDEHEPTVAWDAKNVDPVLVAFHDRYSAVCEQYRAVRARLVTMNSARAPQVLTITSSVPEEGKSVSTVNLGLIMAEGGEHQVLLVDADFRRTSIARMLGVSSAPGLADVLTGRLTLAEALQPTPLPNLKLLPAGEVRDRAYAELLSGPPIAALFEEFRTMFDYALIDTPPVTTVTDVCLMAPHSDGAVLVVEMHRTPEPTVQQAARTLQANNVKILGCILSRFRDRGTSYYEHYYSSYYRR